MSGSIGRRRKMDRMRTTPYKDWLLKRLAKNPEEAVGYLNATLEEKDLAAFLISLRDVVEAFGGMGKLAKQAKLNRVSLYRMLSKIGNPEIFSVDRLLRALGLKLAVTLGDKS